MGTYFKNQFAEEHRIFAAKDDSFRKKIKASSVKLTAISRYLLLSLFLMMILYLTLQVSLASRGPITYSSDISDIIEEIPGKLDLENQDIADTAMDIAGDYPGEYSINQITQIYNALARSRGWFYYSDQANKNSFQNANHTLYMGKIKDTIGVGDCDDFAILMASLLQSIGGSTRIIFAYDEQNNTGHAYTEVYLGERDSPQVDSLLHWLKKEYKVEEIQGLNNTTNETWLNLDWGSDIAEAAYPGAAYFGEGCNNIKKYIIWESNTQNPPTIVPIIDDMESIDGWKMINDTDGSSINISSNLGKENGNAIQISYDLKEIGWVGILREINPEMLSMSSGLKFSYFGMERQDDIELRLEYDDGTTFGISRKPIIGDDMWHSVDAFYSDFECLISSGQNKSLELDLNKIKFIEIIISSNDDEEIVGHGDIIVDDLRGVMAIPSASPWARIEEQKSRNQSIDLASKSRMIRGDSGESLWKSFIYALISMSTYTTRAGYQALREDLEIMPCPVACLPHNDTIYAIAFSPDCKRITTVGSDDYIRSWDTATGEELMNKLYIMPMNSIVFSNNGSMLAIISSDTVRTFNASNFERLAIMRHDDAIKDSDFSDDGKILATASLDNTSRIWNVTSGEELLRINYNTSTHKVVFSEDSKILAIGCLDNSVRGIEVSTGKELFKINSSNPIYDLVFSPDGKIIAGLYKYDDMVHIWNATTGCEIKTLKQDAVITSISFSPNGKCLAIVGLSYEIILWNIYTDAKIKLLHDTWVNYATFSLDGKYLASASDDKTARVWDVNTGEELARMIHTDNVQTVAFSPVGNLLATVSSDNNCRIWDLNTCEKLNIMNHEGSVVDIVFSSDGKYLATASSDGTARIWNSTTSKEISRIIHDDEVVKVAFSSDARLLATAGYDDTVKISEVLTGKEVNRLNYTSIALFVAFSPDGKRMISADRDGTIKLWDTATGKEKILVNGNSRNSIRGISISPDGERLALANYIDNTACIWDIATGKELLKVKHETGTILDTALSLNGKYLSTACTDNTARIWNIQKGKVTAILNHDDIVNAVEFSPDGNILATASNDGSAGIWDVTTGEKLLTLYHESEVRTLAFSPDGKYLATGSTDKTAREWNLTTGEEIGRVNHDALVIDVTFSPDGRYIATGSGDNTALTRLWRADDLFEKAIRCYKLTNKSFIC